MQALPSACRRPRAKATASAPNTGAMAAFALTDGQVRLQPVDLGGRIGRMARVRQGLSAGETVVIDPPAEGVDGARVKPRAAPGG